MRHPSNISRRELKLNVKMGGKLLLSFKQAKGKAAFL